MRISDWSSDVCSSDLVGAHPLHLLDRRVDPVEGGDLHDAADGDNDECGDAEQRDVLFETLGVEETGCHCARPTLRAAERADGQPPSTESGRGGKECVSTGRI